MKRSLFGVMITSLALVLAACSFDINNSEDEETPQSLIPVEAEFNIEEQAQPGDEITLEVEVTQGDEAVDDAHEVLYEVWMENDKEHSEMIESTHDGDGIYSATYMVEEEAVYFVQVHITARGTHVMPRMEVTVGNPDTTEVEEGTDESQDHEDGHDQNDEEDHDGH
ncbi:FixH family protein [Jeotgalibacillus marinus]|uniref:FixH family protein n=1 Tax=Jeotgalibacillus marinus TaxID=86667 RepID=A0ABV3Q4A4_9BACL